MAGREVVRPAADGPAQDSTVAEAERTERITTYRARAQRAAVLAMDRYITDTYGAYWAARSRR